MTLLEWVGVAHTSAALVLALYAAHQAVMLVLYWRATKRHSTPARPNWPQQDSLWPTVTIQLPLFNECYLAQRVIAAAVAQTYPRTRLHIQVLDDSTDDTVQIAGDAVAVARARGVSITCLHRPNRNGYKAGALHNGLDVCESELIAIFDADFVPDPDFLRRVIARWLALDAGTHPKIWTPLCPAAENAGEKGEANIFGMSSSDSRIGFVQTRWDYLNRDESAVTRGQALALDVHFVVEQLARNRYGLPMAFNGSGGIWRRDCIGDAGGWQTDTLTEDLDLSYRAHLRGWRGHYFEDEGAPGDLPRDVLSYKRQQARWSRGTVQTVRKLASRLWRSDWPLTRKLAGWMHLTGYFIHPLMLLMTLTTPLLVLHAFLTPAGTVSSWVNATSVLSLAPMLSMLVAAAARGRTAGSFLRDLPCALLLGIGVSLSNTLSMTRGLLSRESGEFARTPKTTGPTAQRYRLQPDGTLWLEVALAVYSSCAMILLWALGAQLGNQLASGPLLLYALSFGGVAASQIRALLTRDSSTHGTYSA